MAFFFLILTFPFSSAVYFTTPKFNSVCFLQQISYPVQCMVSSLIPSPPEEQPFPFHFNPPFVLYVPGPSCWKGE